MTRNEAHPITVEVVRNAIVADADEMANALMKSAYNMMIYEVRDYCCGLIDTQARMISQSRCCQPTFLADLGVAVADGIERYGVDGFAPGDVVVMNQGAVCGQHLNNVVVYSPCFHGSELVGFAANRAHWVDIGGMHQGFGSSNTSDIYAEGLQIRSLKIYEAGRRNETLWQIIHDNVRYPDSSLGDLRAQVASCQLGARRYGELIGRYGRDTVETCVDEIWDQADRAARSVVAKIPAAHKGDMGGCSFYGFKPDGSRFLLMNIFGGGWGGRPTEDGESASVSICQGDVRNSPVELQEIKYPIIIETHALLRDSGGAG